MTKKLIAVVMIICIGITALTGCGKKTVSKAVLKNDMEKMSENSELSDKAGDISKSMESIKSNIDFMNDLNKNMTYFQMPLRFSQSDANGELYVFTNKKALAQGTECTSSS